MILKDLLFKQYLSCLCRSWRMHLLSLVGMTIWEPIVEYRIEMKVLVLSLVKNGSNSHDLSNQCPVLSNILG